MPIIEMQDVSKMYKKSHLGRVTRTTGVENITLSIQEGEIISLLGLNGSGKTTTIKLLLGLIFPTAGKITISGYQIPDIRARSLIGYLPEVTSLYKFLTPVEILSFFGVLSGIPRDRIAARVASALDQVKMSLHANRRIAEFSKGMQQRVAIAQSIVHQPPILLFDEPVTGIDPIGLKDMRQLILDLNRQGKTILLSSHSISEVEKISHRVGIIVNGRLARIIDQKEWAGKEGYLEKVFIETVQPSLETAGGIS